MKKKFQKKNLIVFSQLELCQEFYNGSPKVHKLVVNNTPKFRPILSAINTPIYSLAKCLNRILSPLTSDEFTVKNSFNFAEKVVNYDHNLHMANLDVESLSTNIPLQETMKN